MRELLSLTNYSDWNVGDFLQPKKDLVASVTTDYSMQSELIDYCTRSTKKTEAPVWERLCITLFSYRRRRSGSNLATNASKKRMK